MRRSNKWRINTSEAGFTLIEVLAAFAILSIILLIAVPFFSGRVDEAKVKVCDANRIIVKKHYEIHLDLGGNDHSGSLFNTFLLRFDGDLCPEDGVYLYVSGQNSVVNCSFILRLKSLYRIRFHGCKVKVGYWKCL